MILLSLILDTLLKGEKIMSLIITHPEKPTEENKIDDNDYMANHHLEGVLPDFSSFPNQKILLPVLIEKKTLPAGTTTTTFSNLNGDSDKLYYITGELSLVRPGTDVIISVQPNSDNTSSNYTGVLLTWARGQNATRANLPSIETGLRLCQTRIEDINNFFHAYLYSKSGKNRKYTSTPHGFGSSEVNAFIISSQWLNNSDNITNLKFVITSGSFSGEIKLYKMVDILLEDIV